MITAVSNCPGYSLTDQRCFVHLMSVEFSKYTVQHRISRLPLPQLNCQSIGRLDFRPFSQLDSTPPSNDQLNRSTRSISGSNCNLSPHATGCYWLHCRFCGEM